MQVRAVPSRVTAGGWPRMGAGRRGGGAPRAGHVRPAEHDSVGAASWTRSGQAGGVLGVAPCPCTSCGSLTLTPNPTLASPGSPFSPLKPFIPGRPWGEHGGGTAGQHCGLRWHRGPPRVTGPPATLRPWRTEPSSSCPHPGPPGGVCPQGPSPTSLRGLRAGQATAPGRSLPAAPTEAAWSLPAARGSRSLPCGPAVRTDPAERRSQA